MTRIVLLLALIFASPVLASAQDLPVVEVRTAFGISNYLHGDIDYTTPTWLVARTVATAVGTAWSPVGQVTRWGWGPVDQTPVEVSEPPR